MAINFQCAELLSYGRRYNFWGDIFNDSATDTYNITSYIEGNPGLNGIYLTWENVSGFISSAYDYQEILIDGVSLGSGRMLSIDFEDGNDLNEKRFSVSFEIPKTGNLYNLTGNYYGDILPIKSAGAIEKLKFVRNIRESFDVSVERNGIQTTNQSVSFDLDSQLLGGPFPLNYSNTGVIFSGHKEEFYGYRDFFFDLFGSRSKIPNIYLFTNFPNIESYTESGGYISNYVETADIVNGNFSFQRSSRYQGHNKALWTYSHNLVYDGNKVTVSEQGLVQSIYFQNGGSGHAEGENIVGALTLWNTGILPSMFSRVNGTYLAAGYTGDCGLLPFPISKEFNENQVVGNLGYSYTFTNDQQYSGSGIIFSNNRSISFDEGGYAEVSEDGEYRAYGSASREDKFQLIYDTYLSEVGNIHGRVDGFFMDTVNQYDSCLYSGDLGLFSKKETFKEWDGTINYSYSYSNDPDYITGDVNFTKISHTIKDSPEINLNNKMVIPRLGEIAQDAQQSSQGVWVNSFEIYGRSGLTPEDYINEVYARVSYPSGETIYLNNFTYSFNPVEKRFSADLSYNYSKYRAIHEILV